MFYQRAYNRINEYVKNLKRLIGSTVQCNFGGPEKGEGILLKVGLDYCVLQCNEAVYYYPLYHIKGYKFIQKDEGSQEDENTEDEGNKNNGNNKNNKNNLEYPVIVSGRRFVDVIDRLKGQKIQFNKGPGKIKGTVVGRNTNHIILEVNDKVVYVSTFHIQSMCWDYENSNNNKESRDGSKSGDNNSDDENGSKNNGNNENSSSNNNSNNESSSSNSNNESSSSSSNNESSSNNNNNNENSNTNSSGVTTESSEIKETVVERDENYIMFEVNDKTLYVSAARIHKGYWWDYYNTNNKE